MRKKRAPATLETRMKMSASLKGRAFSEEHKLKISIALKGTKHSVEFGEKVRRRRLGTTMSFETKKKISEGVRGKNVGPKSYLWRGGITPENKRLRRTQEYKLWRESVFERDDYTCQMCDVRGGRLNADHIKPFAEFPELRTILENGRTLCEPCHRTTETYGWSLYHSRAKIKQYL